MTKISKVRACRSSGITHYSLPYHQKKQTKPSRGNRVRISGSHEGASGLASTHKLPSGDAGGSILPDAHSYPLTQELEAKPNVRSITELSLQEELDGVIIGEQLRNHIPHGPLINAGDKDSVDCENTSSSTQSTTSKILDESVCGIFGGISIHSSIDDFEFTIDGVIKTRGSKCRIKWADSIVHKSDLDERTLHGEPLRNSVRLSRPLGRGFSKVTWLSTWEPIEALGGYMS